MQGQNENAPAQQGQQQPGQGMMGVSFQDLWNKIRGSKAA